jgi:hypothetical protein
VRIGQEVSVSVIIALEVPVFAYVSATVMRLKLEDLMVCETRAEGCDVK